MMLTAYKIKTISFLSQGGGEEPGCDCDHLCVIAHDSQHKFKKKVLLISRLNIKTFRKFPKKKGGKKKV